MNWGDEARRVIDLAKSKGEAMGLSGADLEKHVRAAYPFGERAMWPYKAWLKAVRGAFPKKKDRPEPLFDHAREGSKV